MNVGKDGIYAEGIDDAIDNAIAEAIKDLPTEDTDTTYTLSDTSKDAKTGKVELTLAGSDESEQKVAVDAYTTETLDAKLFEGKYYSGENGTVENVSNISESDKENSRLITPEEMLKLTAIEVLPNKSGAGIAAGKVLYLDEKIETKVTNPINPVDGKPAGFGIEKGAQVNKIEEI